ncbi:integrase [Salmonella enterica subsp. enterica serovar Java]|nr:DUF4102 domain-containing protein [Salmonella enterica]EBX2063716.1 integrase [Salmonella enterica subsp. enterica serovar Java]ECB7399939.1 DUF4102 domain-containing protein [Salmonella enterica subsp. enterica serovar Java]EEP9818684.1 site-specific integrase [Salmonella enterica subsp. diarizonae]EEP9823558.1 site-specific integrase [Salmonella enterica subsp. diarizonae]
MTFALNKLSDSTLKKILGKRAEKTRFISDGGGLSARVSKDGLITWYFSFRTGGRETAPEKIRLGNYPDLSLKAAREKRDQCRIWLAEGKNPRYQLNVTLQETLKPVTVKEAIGYWIDNYGRNNRKEIETIIQQINKHIYPYIGKIPLAQCETYHWLECFDRINRQCETVSGQMLQICKQALVYCRSRRYAVSHALDDLKGIDVGKRANKRDRVHTQQEMGEIWQAVNNLTFHPYYNEMMRLLIVFGCRTGEIRQSEVKEWNTKEWLWTVPKEHSKSEIVIFRPVPEPIRPFIERLIRQNKHTGLLLGEIKKDNAVSEWGRVVPHNKLKQERWSLHDLRRTFITMNNDIGAAPHIINHMTGHSVGTQGAVYNHARYLAEKLDILNKWIERLDLLAGGHENVIVINTAKQA